MDLKRKLRFTAIPLLLCLIVLFAASYAWMIMSISPEITNIDTNVGANGSLEIALLSDRTYVDPLLIRTTVSDSVVAQDVLEANQSWGNMIDLSDERYGMSQLSLHPARLNLLQDQTGAYTLNGSILRVAEFGLDGRINVLSADTVSALYGENDFTYFVDNQRYGIRAIGTISNLSPQQIALAQARTMAQSCTAAASRTAKNVWKDCGPALMNLFSRVYGNKETTCSAEDVALVRETAFRVDTALNYMELALRQGVLGAAASGMEAESAFREVSAQVNDVNIPLEDVLAAVDREIAAPFTAWNRQLKEIREKVADVIAKSEKLTGKVSWAEIKPLLSVLVDGDKTYFGETRRLSDQKAFEEKTPDTVMTLMPGSGVMAQIAEFAGNYSTFFRWTKTENVEVRTADPTKAPYLIQLVDTLKNDSKAASGGWTRANLDDTYGLSVDLAFRCNVESDLLLQTGDSLRVEENTEFPVTQGGGSYMRFSSADMNVQQLVRLMDGIRIGFLDDQNRLVALAKLNTSNYREQPEGVFAPLYLYDHHLEEDGSLAVGERQAEDGVILHLNKNTPTVLSAVVWLDGDHVDNSYVSYLSQQSMTGILNLQFASSADLHATAIAMKEQ